VQALTWQQERTIYLTSSCWCLLLTSVTPNPNLGAQFRLPHHPHIHWKNWRHGKHLISSKNKCYHLPCPALPSVLTQQPQSQSRKQHRETQNNPKPLQRAFFKYTQKKIKKLENKKVEPTSAAIRKPRSAKTKRKITQRTHTHSPPSDDDDDRLPTQRASDDTDHRHPMTRLGSLNPGLGNGN
jgi:hypothetical protein